MRGTCTKMVKAVHRMCVYDFGTKTVVILNGSVQIINVEYEKIDVV